MTDSPSAESKKRRAKLPSPVRSRRRRGDDLRRRQITWIVTLVLALAAIGTAVFFSQRDPVDSIAVGDLGQDDRPVVVNEQALREFGAVHDAPIYWAGPRAETAYELTVTDTGDVFVRYLPLGVAAGNQQPDFLTVATYNRPDAHQALVEVAIGDLFTSEETASGALVVYVTDEPTSAHFSFPDTNLQVEVFDPQPNRALSLVLDGSITILR